MTITNEAQSLADKVRAELPRKIVLDWTDYRDELPDDILAALLTPEGVDWSEHEGWLEGESEARWNAARAELEYVASVAGVDMDDLDDEDVSDLMGDILNRDSFDDIKALTSNGGSKIMRINIASDFVPRVTDDPDGRYDETMAERARMIREALECYGASISDEELSALVENGPWHWHEGIALDVIFYADPSDFFYSSRDRVVTFQNAHALLIDPWSGSGFDAEITGPLSMVLNVDRHAVLDTHAGGYSWTEIAGPAPLAYRTDYTITGE